ncbi:unnamed protein product [Urochloa humidicola]
MNFEIESRYINDFKTLLDKDERIIRHLVMKRDEAITEDCPPPPEFHTLRAQQYFDDEDADEEEEEEDLVARSELDSANYDVGDVEADDEPEIVYVDEADQDSYEDTRRRNSKLKVKKYRAEKVLR